MRRPLRVVVAAGALVVMGLIPSRALAQAATQTPSQTGTDPRQPGPPPQGCPPQGAQTSTPAAHTGQDPNRIFGVLPNYTAVDKCQPYVPLTAKATYAMTARGAFDKVVYPFTAVTAGLAQVEDQESTFGQGWAGYAKRYGMSFADNTLSTFMTTAVLPTTLHQDPRYFVRGEGSTWRRTSYALTRTMVTVSDKGKPQFNISDIGGNALSAVMMNTYHPVTDRTVSATLNRWGTQVLFDGATNVLKEFWPDIRRHFKKSSASGAGG
jgi:hypothetical protein